MDVLPDQVQLVLDVDPRIGIAAVTATIEGATSHALREQFPWLKKRLPTLWTRSRLMATVGALTWEVVQRYLADQQGV